VPSLFDASALANLIIRRGQKALGVTKGNFALDLTGYETGNALWRLCFLEKKITHEEADAFLSTVSGFLNLLQMISFAELDSKRILSLAISKRLAFYEASYIAAAETKRLTLVTDDEALTKVAEEFVETKSSTQV